MGNNIFKILPIQQVFTLPRLSYRIKQYFFNWARHSDTQQFNCSLDKCCFLRTARSFYGSLWYLRTYVQVIFRRSHPTLKLIKQKMSEIIQVNVPNFFYFAEIQKMTKLGPKNRFWDLKIKINPSGSNPTINPLFFEIQTWNFTWWFIATL